MGQLVSIGIIPLKNSQKKIKCWLAVTREWSMFIKLSPPDCIRPDILHWVKRLRKLHDHDWRTQLQRVSMVVVANVLQIQSLNNNYNDNVTKEIIY